MGKKAVTSEEIRFRNARIAFAKIEEPEYFNKDKPQPNEKKKRRYTILLDPTNVKDGHGKIIAKIRAEGERIGLAFWDGKLPKKLDLCYGTDEDLNKVYDGFKGMFWVKVSTADFLPIVGRKKTGPKDSSGNPTFVQLNPGDAEFPRSGSYVNGSLTLWTQDSNNRVAINGNALALQYNAPGEAFGRPSANPNAQFEELETEDADPMFD
jgi:hypothetical protein